MKSFLIAFILLLPSLSNYAQVPYAQWAVLRDSIPEGMDKSYDYMKLHTPDKNEVELQAYPGAKIIETSQSTQSVDDSPNPLLPTITLISNDPAEKIIKVYKDIIGDHSRWHWADNLRMFYKGDLQEALDGHSPYIQIKALTTYEPDLIYISPDILEVANSKIIVCYNPNRLK